MSIILALIALLVLVPVVIGLVLFAVGFVRWLCWTVAWLFRRPEPGRHRFDDWDELTR